MLLASRGEIDNPRNWSGTPYNLHLHFAGMPGLTLQSLNWQITQNILRFYHVALGRFMFIHGTARDPMLSPFFEKKITFEIARLKPLPDFVLFISDYSLPRSIVGRTNYAAYFDSFLGLQMRYLDDARMGMDFFRRHYEAKNRESLERMTLIFTQNEWSRQCLLNEYGLSPDKVCNVGFGINTEPYAGEKRYEDELLLIVLRKGTERYKGLLLLLDAFRDLRKRRPSAKLAVVGTQINDCPEGVTYYFEQPRTVTVELFRKAALYVMPALSEPNGITYLEALANRTPIVGLNRFAVPEFSGYGRWGFLVDREDHGDLAAVLDKALGDKVLLGEMGEAGQKFVMERYTWKAVAEKMVDEMNRRLGQESA